MSYELSPGYLASLVAYRKKNPGTTFGEYVHEKPMTTNGNYQNGFPGYNEGLLLMNLKAIRNSQLYSDLLKKEHIEEIAKKYEFKTNLAAQDFLTLIAYEHPEMFYTLPCLFNRQLCKYWESGDYKNAFNNYSKCDGDVVIYHGNCKTPLP